MNTDDLLRRMVAREDQAFLDFADYFSPRLKAFCLYCGFGSEEAERRVANCITGLALKTVREHREIKPGELEKWVWLQARNTLVECWQFTRWGKGELAELLSLLNLAEEALAALPAEDRTMLRSQRPNIVREREEIGKPLDVPVETVQGDQEKAVRNFQTVLESDPKFRRLLVLLKQRESKQSPK